MWLANANNICLSKLCQCVTTVGCDVLFWPPMDIFYFMGHNSRCGGLTTKNFCKLLRGYMASFIAKFQNFVPTHTKDMLHQKAHFYFLLFLFTFVKYPRDQNTAREIGAFALQCKPACFCFTLIVSTSTSMSTNSTSTQQNSTKLQHLGKHKWVCFFIYIWIDVWIPQLQCEYVHSTLWETLELALLWKRDYKGGNSGKRC